MPEILSVQVAVKHKWWLKYYLAGVLFMRQVTGLEPNEERLVRWILRGIRVVPLARKEEKK